jgi:hypothetical protein
MTIPYSRPPAVKIPGAPKPKANALPSWGRSLFPTQTHTAAPTHSANDQFTLADPYKPGTLQTSATNAYNADVANAQKLAGMGVPTAQQTTADYAQRGANVNSVYQDLAAHLAGIQTAQVAQGNAGSAALGAQNAAIGAAPGVLPTTGTQAVLACEHRGDRQLRRIAPGRRRSPRRAQNQKLLDAGTLAQQTNDQNVQKTLASLLSGLDPVSKRVDAMQTANGQVDATNIQTKYSEYTGLLNQQSQAAALGEKKLADQYGLEAKKYATDAGLQKTISNNQTKLATTNQNNRTKVATTELTQTGAGKRTAAQIAAANKRARASNATSTANNVRTNTREAKSAAAAAAAKTTGGKPVKNYRVTIDVPQPDKTQYGQTVAQDPKTTHQNIPAAVWTRYLKSGPPGKRNLAILGFPKGTIVHYNKATGLS